MVSTDHRVKHWEITASDGLDPVYAWRCIGFDDAIIEAGGPFATYGKAVVDAIGHGFSPVQHHWVKIGAKYTVHFAPGRALPVLIPPDARAAPRAQPLADAGEHAISEAVRDSLGHVVGFIETGSKGTQVLRDEHGQVRGYYDAATDHTRDSKRQILARGNILRSLIW